ncbi:MAG: L-lactate dehydrogenase complex protein LldF, partial [Candidatus Omnitrophota bacterium]
MKIDHAQNARDFTADAERTAWHDDSIWFVREKRDRAAEVIPEWEELREKASEIKMHMLSRLDHYLEEFERNATARGIQVHWAENGEEHNRIVHGIL